jgi:hypothetical protein
LTQVTRGLGKGAKANGLVDLHEVWVACYEFQNGASSWLSGLNFTGVSLAGIGVGNGGKGQVISLSC